MYLFDLFYSTTCKPSGTKSQMQNTKSRKQTLIVCYNMPYTQNSKGTCQPQKIQFLTSYRKGKNKRVADAKTKVGSL